MKFEQACQIIRDYISFEDYIWDMVQQVEGSLDQYEIESVNLHEDSIKVKLSYYDYDRDYFTYTVFLPNTAFDNKEIWLEQVKQQKEQERLERQKLLDQADKIAKDLRREQYEKLRQEFEDEI